MKTGKTKIQWIAGAAAAGGFCFLLLLVLSGKEGCLDDPIRHFFYGLRSDALTPLAIGITDLSNTKFIIALCLILLILPQTRNIYGIPVSMGAIFVTILNKTMKHIIQRPRPEDIEHLVQEGGYSFPSGHSITSMFVYGMLLYLIWIHVKNRRLRNILSVLVMIPLVLVGPSRIYLGVHYPTDVLAGWCLGFVVLMAAIGVMQRITAGREIMKFMDMAAAAVAMKFSKGNCVTARVDELLFHLPIFVGALVTCTASLVYVGRTSMEVLVRVESEDLESHSGPEKALSANFTMVCMGKNGRPQAIGREYVPETELEKKLWKEAEERREIIKQRKAEKKAAAICK
jgi:undecaprenyl-diphosphatase